MSAHPTRSDVLGRRSSGSGASWRQYAATGERAAHSVDLRDQRSSASPRSRPAASSPTRSTVSSGPGRCRGPGVQRPGDVVQVHADPVEFDPLPDAETVNGRLADGLPERPAAHVAARRHAGRSGPLGDLRGFRGRDAHADRAAPAFGLGLPGTSHVGRPPLVARGSVVRGSGGSPRGGSKGAQIQAENRLTTYRAARSALSALEPYLLLSSRNSGEIASIRGNPFPSRPPSPRVFQSRGHACVPRPSEASHGHNGSP